ncbi:hypothetical protein TKK_0009909 [Trichogramma kaykai]
MEIITQSVKDSTPGFQRIPSNFKKSNPVPWWDDECAKLKRLRRAAFKKWESTLDLVDLINYKKTCAQIKKNFKKKKKECFIKFAESLDFHSNSKYVWEKCKIFKNRWIKTAPSNPNNNKEKEKYTEIALDKISPPSAETDPNAIPDSQPNPFFDIPFSFAEFNSALDLKKTSSSPGMDGIDFEILTNLPTKYKLICTDIFNSMFTEGDFPTSWKHSFLHFIPKSDGKNVRPIALTSCLCKLFETILKNRLQWWVEHKNILPENQYGFRKGKSTTDNMLNLALKIQEAFLEKKDVLAASLDVMGAFDNINIDILLQKLSKIGCSSATIKFIHFLTHKRKIFTSSLPENTFRLVYKGVPQGGVLSPLLYIIYVSDISLCLQKSISISQFADDLCVYTKCADTSRGKSILQKAIIKLKNNLLDIGLDLAESKTVFVHFNLKNVPPGSSEIQIDNCTIKSSESLKFLGLHFDYKLNFDIHLNHVQKKCHRAMNILRFLCKTWWGSSPITLIILYKSYIRSIIDYGLPIYFPSKKKAVEKLERIQNSAIRTSLGLRISTPLNILLAESKLISIENRAQFLCHSFLAKTMALQNSQTHKNITKFHNIIKNKPSALKNSLATNINDFMEYISFIESQKNENIYTKKYEIITNPIPFDSLLGESLKDAPKPNNEIDAIIKNNNALSFYTDGSKISESNCVGSAVFCPELEIYETLSIEKKASVYTAECIAMHEAFNLAIKHLDRNIFIFTDSLSTLQTLASSKTRLKTNSYILKIKELYAEFLEKSHGKSEIKLFWIPSHIGIDGNEQADLLAKSATKSEFPSLRTIPFTDMLETFKKNAHDHNEDKMISESLFKGTIYFERYYRTQKKPWYWEKNLNREQIVTVNRARANHYSLNYSLARLGMIENGICSCETSEENLNHVIWQCHKYESSRQSLLKSLRSLKYSLPLNIESFLICSDIPALKLILKFFKDCGLQI